MYGNYPNYNFNPQSYNSNPYLDRLNNVQNNLSQAPQNTASNNLIRVTGIEGAKAYQMTPNSTVALFDGNEDVMYIKSSDGANFPTIKTFRFQAVETVEPNNTEYVSKDEFNKFKLQLEEMFTNAKQSIWEQQQSKPTTSNSTTTKRKQSNGNDETV